MSILTKIFINQNILTLVGFSTIKYPFLEFLCKKYELSQFVNTTK